MENKVNLFFPWVDICCVHIVSYHKKRMLPKIGINYKCGVWNNNKSFSFENNAYFIWTQMKAIQPNVCTIERLSAIYRRSIIVWSISERLNHICDGFFFFCWYAIAYQPEILSFNRTALKILRNQKSEVLNAKIELNWNNSWSFWLIPNEFMIERQLDFHWNQLNHEIQLMSPSL